MRVIIAGSRTFNNYEFLKTHCLKIFRQLKAEGRVGTIRCEARGGSRLRD